MAWRASLAQLVGWPTLPTPGAMAAVQAATTPILTSDQLAQVLGGVLSGKTGRTVSERTAMQNSTLNRAAVLISSAIGMLPLNLMRRTATGLIEKADAHPVYQLLRVKPNAAQTPFQFKSYMQGRALLKGNAYAYKVPGVNRIQALWPLDPDRVELQLDEQFRLTYKYTPKKGAARTFQAGEIMHLRAPWSSDGVSGTGLLTLAAEALGLAEITEESAAAFLRNGASPGGMLSTDKKLSPEALDKLRQQFADNFAGSRNAGKWIVGEEGLKATPLPSNSKDAEALAHRKYQAEEISRFTGVPRPLLMFDETSWGSGIEQLGIFFVTYCLMPWFVAWEEAIAQALLTEAERATLYAKFNEAALLRGSLKDQAEFFAKALGGPGAGGFMLPDEAREKMDMNPLPGGIGNDPAWKEGTPANVNP